MVGGLIGRCLIKVHQSFWSHTCLFETYCICWSKGVRRNFSTGGGNADILLTVFIRL